MGKKYIVTGATSFIGYGLLNRLVREAEKIFAICRPESNNMNRIPNCDNIKVIECSLDELGKLKATIGEDCDVFFHLGWEGTGDKNNCFVQNRNIQYTLDAAKLASELGCTLFLGAGSQAEYGIPNIRINENTPAFPITGYGISKLCAGQMSRIFAEQKGLKHIWTRIFSVYGPYDAQKTFVSSMINCFLDSEVPKITLGEQIWDYLYIDDCAEALFLLSEKAVNSGIYNIGSGIECKIKVCAEKIRDIIAPSLAINFGAMPYDNGTPMFLSADINKLKRDTGFEPSVSFEDGIMEMLKIMRK